MALRGRRARASATIPLMPRPLTLKQQRFAEAYALSGNATQAARDAGYRGPPSTVAPDAHHRLNDARIALEILRFRSAAQAARRLDLESWRSSLLDFHRRAVLAEDLGAEGRALEIEGRHLGALDPQAPANPQVAELIRALAEGIATARLKDERALAETRTYALAPAPDAPAREGPGPAPDGDPGVGTGGTP